MTAKYEKAILSSIQNSINETTPDVWNKISVEISENGSKQLAPLKAKIIFRPKWTYAVAITIAFAILFLPINNLFNGTKLGMNVPPPQGVVTGYDSPERKTANESNSSQNIDEYNLPGISKKLADAMNNNKGKNVLYRVMVLDLGVSQYHRDYKENGLAINDVQSLIVSSKPDRDKYDYYYKLFNDMLKRAQENFIDYSIQRNGVSNAEKPVISSSYSIGGYTFIAELTEGKIKEIAKSGCQLRLALPKRLEKYSRRIGDILAYELEIEPEGAIYTVNVYSTLDKSFKYNNDYNADLFVQWPQERISKQNIQNFLYEILRRNGINKEVQYDIINSHNNEINQSFIQHAYFTVELNKEEIIKLSEDKDVRLIEGLNNFYDSQERRVTLP